MVKTTLTFKCMQWRNRPTKPEVKIAFCTHISQRQPGQGGCAVSMTTCWNVWAIISMLGYISLSFTHVSLLSLNPSINTFNRLPLKMTTHFRHRCIFHYMQWDQLAKLFKLFMWCTKSWSTKWNECEASVDRWCILQNTDQGQEITFSLTFCNFLNWKAGHFQF